MRSSAPCPRLGASCRACGLWDKCPPASACGECLLLYFVPKATGPAGHQTPCNSKNRVPATPSEFKGWDGCPWARNKGGGVGRRPTPEDIRVQGQASQPPQSTLNVPFLAAGNPPPIKPLHCPGNCDRHTHRPRPRTPRRCLRRAALRSSGHPRTPVPWALHRYRAGKSRCWRGATRPAR